MVFFLPSMFVRELCIESFEPEPQVGSREQGQGNDMSTVFQIILRFPQPNPKSFNPPFFPPFSRN